MSWLILCEWADHFQTRKDCSYPATSPNLGTAARQQHRRVTCCSIDCKLHIYLCGVLGWRISPWWRRGKKMKPFKYVRSISIGIFRVNLTRTFYKQTPKTVSESPCKFRSPPPQMQSPTFLYADHTPGPIPSRYSSNAKNVLYKAFLIHCPGPALAEDLSGKWIKLD